MDADDLVSNQLAQLSYDNPECNGWYMHRSYLHRENSQFVVFRNNFHMLCGTSAIVKVNARDLPSSPNDESPCTILDYGHGVIVEAMRERHMPLRPLHFPGAIYITGTGENDSGFSYNPWASRRRSIGELVNHRFITERIRHEFNLVPVSNADVPIRGE